MAECTERDKLREAAQRSLTDIVVFAEKLKAALREGVLEDLSVIKLDKDLENAVGAKERAFGALTQHRKDHGC